MDGSSLVTVFEVLAPGREKASRTVSGKVGEYFQPIWLVDIRAEGLNLEIRREGTLIEGLCLDQPLFNFLFSPVDWIADEIEGSKWALSFYRLMGRRKDLVCFETIDPFLGGDALFPDPKALPLGPGERRLLDYSIIVAEIFPGPGIGRATKAGLRTPPGKEGKGVVVEGRDSAPGHLRGFVKTEFSLTESNELNEVDRIPALTGSPGFRDALLVDPLRVHDLPSGLSRISWPFDVLRGLQGEETEGAGSARFEDCICSGWVDKGNVGQGKQGS
jgi:hypothetical protein